MMKTNQKRIRLLLTASTFPRWKDDTEPRFILDLAKAYTRFFDVAVLAPSAPGAADEELIEGVRVLRYHYFPIHRWETLCYPGAIVPRIKEKKVRVILVPFLFLGLRKALKKRSAEYDCVHAHWLVPQGIVQKTLKKKYILTSHGSDVTALNQIGFIKNLKKKAIAKAGAYTVVSESLAEAAVQAFGISKPPVISMGCDLTNFSPKYRRAEFFDQKGKPVVLFVGRLAEIKGVQYLIDAVRDLDVKLVIAGDGPLAQELKSQALPQGDKIVFLGAKTHEELREIYASADIFAAPSVTAKDGGKEGLGLVLLEAMASGCAVIGSDTGGIPEIVKNGRNGLLVPEKDTEQLSRAIKLLAEDVELRKQYAAAGLETAKERDYGVIAERYARLIAAAVEK